ncbi:hypothetical protein HH214_03235 [Mucilaginibacter robiniae]|uniref:PBCV-specific basic adaptor domain-containing protein n=1 Tax=Mucilaginibacter robiniae TaxID=2728022 RepID=A0A7L5DV67_9SPHI|nr:hypothetical protein [Mucilaginibacter robiniae]QJD94962.1 hypothetical protein HH214_03235 [Mucilaginibacter robiniae]
MKNVFKVALLATGLFVAAQTQAQVVKKTEHAIGRTATKVGHKTSELASKGSSAIVDKKYDGKGRYGETVYIDKHSRYYYVNKRGHRVYVKGSYLRHM